MRCLEDLITNRQIYKDDSGENRVEMVEVYLWYPDQRFTVEFHFKGEELIGIFIPGNPPFSKGKLWEWEEEAQKFNFYFPV